ncbi:MAG: hypothetical protein SGPRY_000034 [Prymnesium sp.]
MTGRCPQLRLAALSAAALLFLVGSASLGALLGVAWRKAHREAGPLHEEMARSKQLPWRAQQRADRLPVQSIGHPQRANHASNQLTPSQPSFTRQEDSGSALRRRPGGSRSNPERKILDRSSKRNYGECSPDQIAFAVRKLNTTEKQAVDWIFSQYAIADWLDLEHARQLLRSLPRVSRDQREIKISRYFAHCHRAGWPDGRIRKDHFIWMLTASKASGTLTRILAMKAYHQDLLRNGGCTQNATRSAAASLKKVELDATRWLFNEYSSIQSTTGKAMLDFQQYHHLLHVLRSSFAHPDRADLDFFFRLLFAECAKSSLSGQRMSFVQFVWVLRIFGRAHLERAALLHHASNLAQRSKEEAVAANRTPIVCKTAELRGHQVAILNITVGKPWRYYTAMTCPHPWQEDVCLTYKSGVLGSQLEGLRLKEGRFEPTTGYSRQVLASFPGRQEAFVHNACILRLRDNEFVIMGGMQGFQANQSCMNSTSRFRKRRFCLQPVRESMVQLWVDASPKHRRVSFSTAAGKDGNKFEFLELHLLNFFAVERNPVANRTLLALFPVSEPPWACVAAAFSRDGLTFSRAVSLQDAPVAFRKHTTYTTTDPLKGGFSARGEDHPVAGVVSDPTSHAHLLVYIHHAVRGLTYRDVQPHVTVYRLPLIEVKPTSVHVAICLEISFRRQISGIADRAAETIDDLCAFTSRIARHTYVENRRHARSEAVPSLDGLADAVDKRMPTAPLELQQQDVWPSFDPRKHRDALSFHNSGELPAALANAFEAAGGSRIAETEAAT